MLKIRLKLTQKQRGLLQSVPTNRSSALHPLTSGLIVTYTLATSPLLFPACDDLLLGDPRMPLLKPLPAGKPRLSSCHTPRCMTVPFWTSMPHTAAREVQQQVINVRARMAEKFGVTYVRLCQVAREREMTFLHDLKLQRSRQTDR
jgi:hypothetical protein